MKKRQNIIVTAVVLCMLMMSIFAVPIMPGPNDAVSAENTAITVDNTYIVRSIPADFHGVNYVAFWDGAQGSLGSREALRRAGVKVIRFPGGEPGNWLDWSKTSWSSTDTLDMRDYANGVGAKLLFQTNPTVNGVNDAGQLNDPSGTHAADWVTYCMNNNVNVPYWEIGNEQDIHLQNANDYNYMQWYYDRFNEHYTAMKQRNSNITVMGPVATNVWMWWGLNSLGMFKNRCGSNTDAYSLHYYKTGSYPGYAQIVDSAQYWQACWDMYVSTVVDKPLYVTEWNSMGQPGECNRTAGSAICNADTIGAFARSGVDGHCFFGAIHGINDNWGILGGGGDVLPLDTPGPNYYILPLWSNLGEGVLNVTNPADKANSLSVWAHKKANGSIQVMLINKTAAQTVDVNFTGFDPNGKTVRVHELKAANAGAWDFDIYYNGVLNPNASTTDLPAPATFVNSGSTVTRTLPAFSATVLEFPAVVGSDTAAPTVPSGLTAAVDPVYSANQAVLNWNTSVDNVGVAGYKIYRNGIQIARVNGGTTYKDTALSPSTTYSFAVSAYDLAGNECSRCSAVSMTTEPVDTQPPTVPSGFAATAVSSAEIGLSWNPSSDNKAVSGYKVYRSGTRIADVTGTSYKDKDLTPNTACTYSVVSYDPTGNESAQSSPATATTMKELVLGNNAQPDTVDNTAGGYYNANRYYVSSNMTMDHMMVKLDQAYNGKIKCAIYTDNNGSPGSLVMGTEERSALSAGWHSLGFSSNVTLTAGNYYWFVNWKSDGCKISSTGEAGSNLWAGLSYSGTWPSTLPGAQGVADKRHCMYAVQSGTTVDIQAPVVPANVTASPVSTRQIDVAWNASSDNIQVLGYYIYRNGVRVATVINNTRYSDTGLMVDTAYTYNISAFDTAGNESAQSAGVNARTHATGSSGLGLTGQYFDNGDLTDLKLTRTDPKVEFYWAGGSPDASIGPDAFSVRWTGEVEPLYTETYTFYVYTDDGVRLWVNGQLLIDNWVFQGATEKSGTISLNANQKYSIRMEYFDNTGDAMAYLSWSSPSTPKQVIPSLQLYPSSTVDTQSPTAPAGLTAATVSQSQISLSWNASSDNTGVSGYKVYRGGTQIAITASTSYSDTGLAESTTYSYTVAAYDAAGNQSAQCTAVSAATPGQGNTDNAMYNFENGELHGMGFGNNATMTTDAAKAFAGQSSAKVAMINNYGELHKYNNDDPNLAAGATVALRFFVPNDGSNIDFYLTLRDNNWRNVTAELRATNQVKGAWNEVRMNLPAAASDGTFTYDWSQIIEIIIIYASTAQTTFWIDSIEVIPAGAGDTVAPTVPSGLTATMVSSSQINLSWSASSDNVGVTGYKVYRNGTQIATTTLLSYSDTGLAAGATYIYTMAACDLAGNTSAQSSQASATTQAAGSLVKLTGTPFGLSPAWAPGREYDKATDGDVNTFYDYANGDGGYTGIDLGAGNAAKIVKIRYYPRGENLAYRMVGGKFQGSNTGTDSGYVDLYTITSEPPYAWTEVTVSDATAYRYIRYLAPNGAYGNIAEMEFYTETQVPETGNGLKGEYFASTDFTSPVLTRTDATVDYDWGGGSPDTLVPGDNFSARWTGKVKPLYTETYTFYTLSDDGVRLWVNGQLVIDNWSDHAPTENAGTITLTAGQKYDIKMEFYERGGGATARLYWSSASQTKGIIPQSALFSTP